MKNKSNRMLIRRKLFHLRRFSLLGSGFFPPRSAFSSGSVRVELEHRSDVSQRILLAASSDSTRLFWRIHNRLNFIGLKHSLQVGILNNSGRNRPVLFGRRTSAEIAVDFVEGGESVFSEDHKASDVSAWREFEDVQTVDVEKRDTWDIAEGFDNTVVVVVDNARTEFLYVSAASHGAFTGASTSGGVNAFDIVPSAEGFEYIDGLFGLLVSFDVVRDNERNFWDVIDLMAFSHDESWYTGGGDSRGHSVTTLVDVTLFVPFSPGFEWSEHATTAAHVTESGLAGAVGTATAYTWDTGHGATGSP